MRPGVTVYITCHNYGRFVAQAIDSVYDQIFQDWELLIIDDGSTDDSAEVIAAKAAERPEVVRLIHNPKPIGLPRCANLAIEEARGKYLIRLDADDYFDESALLTMSTFLDQHSEIALVFPNYIYVDQHGSYLGVENRKKIGIESKVHDLPAHGACTMVRKRVLKSVGGYNSDHPAQDGHQVWLNILNRYEVANVSTPLFFYRQHASSLTTDKEKILNVRQKIKRQAASKFDGEVKPRVIGVVPARNVGTDPSNVCLAPVAGKPLIDYTMEAALSADGLDAVLVASDDRKVLEHCAEFPRVHTYERSLELSQSHTKLVQVMKDAVDYMERELELFPDILVTLNVHAPLKRGGDIDEAIDTLLLMSVDSVISVYEDRDLHFHHGQNGMTPLNKGALNRLYLEREALYVDNGAVKASWRDVLAGESLYGETQGHITMPYERSFLVQDKFTQWLVADLLERSNPATGEVK